MNRFRRCPKCKALGLRPQINDLETWRAEPGRKPVCLDNPGHSDTYSRGAARRLKSSFYFPLAVRLSPSKSKQVQTPRLRA